MIRTADGPTSSPHMVSRPPPSSSSRSNAIFTSLRPDPPTGLDIIAGSSHGAGHRPSACEQRDGLANVLGTRPDRPDDGDQQSPDGYGEGSDGSHQHASRPRLSAE